MFLSLILTLAVLCVATNAFLFVPLSASTSSRQSSLSLMEMFDEDFKQMGRMMSSSLLSSPRVLYNPRRKTVMVRPKEMIRTISDEDFFGSEVSRLFNSDTIRYSTGSSGTGLKSFNIDFKENEERLEISADLPGFKKNEVRIEIKDHMLVISAEKVTATEAATPAAEPTELSNKAVNPEEDKATFDTAKEEIRALNTEVVASTDRVWLKERASFQGSTSRSIQLPKDCDESNITATMEDGVLTVVVPRLPPQQPKVVNIE